MKRLRNKTFITIFSIFSCFLIILIVAYNVGNYKEEYDSVKNSLFRLNAFLLPKDSSNDNRRDDTNRRIVIDYDVYTVLLNENNSVVAIINNGNEVNTESILSIANKILESNTQDSITINNLYRKGYSYNLKNYNSLVIIDTSNITSQLRTSIIVSLFMLSISLSVIYFISKLITNHIVKPAEESFQKQKEFIADASHELKTPLAVIMASSEALESDPKEKKWLNNIKDESDRMNSLITSLLDLSKLESGVDKQTYTVKNISKIVEKSALTFESLAFENNVTIDTKIEADINLNCSSTEIKELLSILIDNAIKHSFKDKTINIKLYKQKNDIVLEVINEGNPIPKEDEEKIFERFYRLDKSRNRNSNRYGLGLAIAKNIVINHNGKITASSKDCLTTFKIVFKSKD